MRRTTRNGQIALGLALGLGAVAAIEATDDRNECGWGFQLERVERGDGDYQVHLLGGGCRFEARIGGDFTVDDAESMVTAVGAGGRIEIDDRSGDVRRRFEATAGPDGPRILYLKDGDEAPFDDDAKAWLAVALPRALRVSGADVEARIDRLWRRGGLDLVLEEAEKIRRDHEARVFLTAVREHGLDAAGEAAVLRLAGRSIGADGELADHLSEVEPALLEDAGARAALVEAAGSIGSDGELRRALSALLRAGDVGPGAAAAIVEAAAGIGSDADLADLVVHLAETVEEPLPRRMADRLREIGADSELRRALIALLQRPAVAEEAPNGWLDSASNVGADTELAEVLTEAAARWPEERPLPDSFFAAAAGIGSDSELARALAAVVERSAPTETDLARLLRAADGIGSDSELGDLLLLLAERRPEITAGADFASARRGIGARSEQERIDEALASR